MTAAERMQRVLDDIRFRLLAWSDPLDDRARHPERFQNVDACYPLEQTDANRAHVTRMLDAVRYLYNVLGPNRSPVTYAKPATQDVLDVFCYELEHVERTRSDDLVLHNTCQYYLERFRDPKWVAALPAHAPVETTETTETKPIQTEESP